MAEEGKFWMVYVEGKSSPTKKHADFNEAYDEARRLAKKEGRDTYLLQAVSKFYTEVHASGLV